MTTQRKYCFLSPDGEHKWLQWDDDSAEHFFCTSCGTEAFEAMQPRLASATEDKETK